MFDDLAEKFADVFGKQMERNMFNMVQFHIGIHANGRLCYDVNGADPLKVAEGFQKFEAALKKTGMIKREVDK